MRETFRVNHYAPYWRMSDGRGRQTIFTSRDESIAMAIRLAKVANWRGIEADVIVGGDDDIDSPSPIALDVMPVEESLRG